MIAAARRRIGAAAASALGLARRWTWAADRWARRGLAANLTRRVDRAVDHGLRRAYPVLARRARRARAVATRWARWGGRRLRPLAVMLLRAFSAVERRLRRLAALAARAARRVWALLSFERLICAAIVLAALALVASQFVDYRSVEIGQPGYAGLPAADPPTVGGEAAGQAHAYLLIPLALLAAALALATLRGGRRRGTRPGAPRARLASAVFSLGLVALAVVLLVDLPAGLDEGAQQSRFSGATAVLEDGFYLELAAAVGLILGGLLYYAGPCRIRISSFARAASGPRRRRRRRASSRARDARRRSPRRSAAVSAPVSRR